MSSLPPPAPPVIWIIVLNWNSAADTLACVDSIRNQEGGDWRLAVCDNASTDGSMAILRDGLRARFGDDLTEWTEDGWVAAIPVGRAHLVANRANHGYAGGNNAGIRLALRDPTMAAILVLNNDAEMEAGCLSALSGHLEACPDQGVVGCTLVYHDRPGTLQAAGGGRHERWTGRSLHHGYGQPRQTAAIFTDRPLDYVFGAAMLIRRACLEQVGLMAEDLFLYYEEIDYARQLRGRFQLGYCPDAVVRHKEGGSTGGKRHAVSALAEFHLLRNRLRITRRHFPYALPTVLLWLLVPLARHVLARRWGRARMIVRIAFGFGHIRWPRA